MESTLDKNFPWTAGAARLIWPEGPARRKRWVVVATIILLLVLAHTLWTAIASARLNRVTDRLGERWGSMALSTLAPPEVDDRYNAAKPVRAAGELLHLPAPVVGKRDRYKRLPIDPAGADRFFVDVFVDGHNEAPDEIVLDLDATDDPLHGQQEGRFFHGYFLC